MKHTILLSIVCSVFGLCINFGVDSSPTQRDACSSISTVSSYSRTCIAVLSALNRTTHTDSEICQIYNEVANCIRNKAIRNGEPCDVHYLHTTLNKLATYTHWMAQLHTETCEVTELTESICTSPNRLGMVSMLACGLPILGGFRAATQAGFICSTISGLDVCTDNYLSLLGDAHCTSANIRDGLESTAARQWRKTHLPDVNLDPCFTVYHPGQTGHDSECTDIGYISRHTQQAMGVMYLNNVTTVGQQLWCSTFYYSMHLLQHEVEQAGHVCELSDIQKEFSRILGYQGVKNTTLSACQGQMEATPSEFCSDKTTVLQVMANEPYCKPYLNNVANSTNAIQTCMYVKQFKTCSETKLKFSGFDCDSTVFDDVNIDKLLKMKYHVGLPTC